MLDVADKDKIEDQIKEIKIQIKNLEDGLAMEALEENEKLYRYLVKQKKYELVEQRANTKLIDIEEIKEFKDIIKKSEKKLVEIEKIKELKAQIEKLHAIKKS